MTRNINENPTRRRLKRVPAMASTERSAEEIQPSPAAVTTTVQEQFGLSNERVLIIDLKISLTEEVRRRRQELGLTQSQLAQRVGIRQPRLAAIENGAEDASLEALFELLLHLGVTPLEIGVLIGKEEFN